VNRIAPMIALALAFAVPTFPKGSNGKTSGKTIENVRGYTKKSGRVVAPHDRTAPNGSASDNWSTKGNVNPETGKKGTKKPKN
jgi:hypothetical protein